MKRHELEHILRAAGMIAQVDRLIVLGSQSILGRYPDPPAELTVSQEADLYPPDCPEKADLIDGCIGELSPFHENFGYYAQGVGPETAILARGWQDRLVEIRNDNTHGIQGLCLSPMDLIISKLVAGREKDRLFVQAMLAHRLVRPTEVEALFPGLPEGFLPVVERNWRLWRNTRD